MIPNIWVYIWYYWLYNKLLLDTSDPKRHFQTREFVLIFVGLYGGQMDYFTHQVMNRYNLTDYFRNDEVVNNHNYCGDDFTDEAINIAKVSRVTLSSF